MNLNKVLTLDTDIELGWYDARIYRHLKQMNFTDPNTNMEFRNRSLDATFLDQIWKPDIFIGSFLPHFSMIENNSIFSFPDEMVDSDKVPLIGKLVTLDFWPARGWFLLFARFVVTIYLPSQVMGR